MISVKKRQSWIMVCVPMERYAADRWLISTYA